MNHAHAPVILDVAGLALDADDRRRLAHPLAGGIILFARNWRDRLQLTELVAEAKSIRSDLLVCVDHEGGRVQRFRTDGFTHLPPMDAYGKRWMDDGAGPLGDGAMAATDAATAAGFVMAAELRSCGVDLSFAPVKPSRARRMSCSQGAEKPAGRSSTSGYTTCAGITLASEVDSHS